MNNTSYKLCNIVLYYLRKSIVYIVSFLLCTLISLFVFKISSTGIVKNIMTLDTLKDTNKLDVVFTDYIPNKEDSYLFLNNDITFQKENIKINSDVVMQINSQYEDNAFKSFNILKPNTCAISKNVLDKYDLKIGDYIITTSEEYAYKIVEELPCQVSLLSSAYREGVIVLSNTSAIESTISKTYVTFMKDLSGTSVSNPPIYLKDRIIDAKNGLIKTCSVSIAILFIYIILYDLIIKPRKKKYKILIKYGKERNKIFGTIFCDKVLEYLLGHIVAIICCYFNFAYISQYYWFPMVIFIAIDIVFLLVFCLCETWRITSWKVKKRKF